MSHASKSSTGTLQPLKNDVRHGLTGVGLIALISFLATIALFLCLTYKLIVSEWKERRTTKERSHTTSDLSLGLPERHYPLNNVDRQPQIVEIHSIRRHGPRNPFPILIYNVLLAEMMTSLGYTLNLGWLAQNGIIQGTPLCWIQGFFNSLGILASSVFFISVSTNTYLTVVWGWTPPKWAIYTWIFLDWFLVLALTLSGVVYFQNGEAHGGWFVRANTWCWINEYYESARLWSVWAWVLVSIPVTILLYILVFLTLFRENRSSRHLPRRFASSVTGNETHRPSGHHPAFFVYPFVYIACTSPLAVARFITLRGRDPADIFYYVAGAMIAINGLLNTILWSTTMIYSTPEDIRDTGLDRFVFMRTPHWRQYGNMVWIQGRASAGGGGGGWWWWKLGGQTSWNTKQPRGVSQESLRGLEHGHETGIHLDVVTTIVIEDATVEIRRDNANSIDSIRPTLDTKSDVQSGRA